MNDYITANGPIPAYSSTPSGIDERPSVAQTTAFATALSSYYRVGDQVSYTASTINGLNPTPASYSFALSANANDNVKTFVYGEEDGTSDEDGESTGGVASDGELASTGANLALLVSGASIAVLVAVAILRRR